MKQVKEYADVSFIKNLPQELLNAVGKYTERENEYDDIRLFQRKTLQFRDIIDSSFPTMLVINYANIKRELQKYQDIAASIKQAISTDYQPTQADFDTKKLTDKEISLVITAIKKAVQRIDATPISSAQLQQRLQSILNINASSATIISQVKALFSKVYKLTDASGGEATFIFPSFASVGSLSKYLDIGMTVAVAEAGEGREIPIGKLLDYGHTAVGYSDQGVTKLQFNTPKLIGIMYDVLQSGTTNIPDSFQKVDEAVVKFIDDTRQVEEFIEVTKDFSEGFLKIFVSIGGNIIRFENSVINQRRGSILEKKEKRGANKVVLAKLATEFSKIGGLGSKIARALTIGRSSPSVVDYITGAVVAALEGDKIANYKDTAKVSKTTTKKIKTPVVSGFTKGLTKVKLPRKPAFTPTVRSNIDLNALLVLLNSHLAAQIKKNMGQGDRSDILNYRTGRFANSARVERISESRQGMITAFYNYMKNPYATFSAGGAQGFPVSRDPKLLISKSIRELASAKIANRMRAVAL